MTRQERLLAQIERDPYNEVSAHRLPDGGLCLMLSHRITLDAAVIVRVPEEGDIAFMYGGDADEEAINERTNSGGHWVEHHRPVEEHM